MDLCSLPATPPLRTWFEKRHMPRLKAALCSQGAAEHVTQVGAYAGRGSSIKQSVSASAVTVSICSATAFHLGKPTVCTDGLRSLDGYKGRCYETAT